MECLVIIHDWPTFSQVPTLLLFLFPSTFSSKSLKRKAACCETSASSLIGIKLPSHPFHWESLWRGAADSHGPAPDSNPGWHFAERPAGWVHPSTAAFTTGQYNLQYVIVLSKKLKFWKQWSNEKAKWAHTFRNDLHCRNREKMFYISNLVGPVL